MQRPLLLSQTEARCSAAGEKIQHRFFRLKPSHLIGVAFAVGGEEMWT